MWTSRKNTWFSSYVWITGSGWVELHRRRQWHPTPVPLPGKSHGRRSLVHCSPWVRWVRHNFPFTFHFHALEKEMATHSSVLARRIPGTGEPGGLPSMGSHRVGHDWSDLAPAAAELHWSRRSKDVCSPGSLLGLCGSTQLQTSHCCCPGGRHLEEQSWRKCSTLSGAPR